MDKSRPDPVESHILEALDGTEESYLEVSIAEDGSVYVYEAYSEDAGAELARRLKRLGVRLTCEHSSLCG